MQIDNHKRIASSKKANKDKLVKSSEFAKRALIDTLQGELSSAIELAETKDKVREDTIKQLIHFLKENELHIPKSRDWTEPAIYISVLQSLTKQTQDNLHAICRLINKTLKASEEEEQAKLELKNCEAEYMDPHETLTYKMAELNQPYIALVDLELDHDNIRKKVI